MSEENKEKVESPSEKKKEDDIIIDEQVKEKKEEKKVKGFTYDAYADSNCLSSLFFFWCFKLLHLCSLTKLTVDHLGILRDKNKSENYSKIITYFWEEKGYKNKKSNALMKTILRANLCRLLLIIFLCILASGTEYCMVLLQKEMIDYFGHKEDVTVKPMFDFPLLYMGIAFLSLQILNIFFSNHQYMKQDVFGKKAGFELSCFIYEKILSASPSSFIQRATPGEIVNFIQIDSNKLSWMIQTSTNVIIGPILICAYIYLLFDFFGVAFFAGFGVLVISLIVNYFIFRKFRILDEVMLHKKDERMKVTTETFDNIKTLKLYNWENEFKSKIYEAREEEMTQAAGYYRLVTVNIFLFWFAPVLVSIATIGIYQYLNDKFNISTMLIGLAIFARLTDPLGDLPMTINSVIETVISMKRIEKFIRQPERIETNVIRGNYDINGEFAIKIEHGDFTWGVKQKKEEQKEEKKETNKKKKVVDDKIKKDFNEPLIPNQSISQSDISVRTEQKNNEPIIEESKSTTTESEQDKIQYDIALKDITINIKPGEIVGIIGEVGSGKSSLFEAILNSLILLNPDKCDGIHINGTVGYVCQSSWIQNATIKDNILFFKEEDPHRYQEVLEQSQLKFDLANFEGGDQTEIGEKGINLSGGQKVRVSLARALYSNPDIYLFDDPISALDANIGKKIMKQCIIKYLEGKTRIVATHAIHYLKHMDKIIYLHEGRIAWTGTYLELLQQPFFDSLNKLSKVSKHRSSDADEYANQISTIKKDEEKKEEKKEVVKIIADEDEEIGVVKFDVYKAYARYLGGVCFTVIIILIMFFWQFNKGASDIWLAFWSQKENQGDSTDKNKKWRFFGIYSALGVASSIFIFFRIFLLSKGTVRLGRKLHFDMVEKLIKAPINLFHETIPRGQIFNRLSKDLESIQAAMYVLGNVLVGLFMAIGAITICSIYDPYSCCFVPMFLIGGYVLNTYYLRGSRQLCRLEAISHSPILNTINETIPGCASILAFDRKENYFNKFFKTIDDSFKINIFLNGLYNWLNLQYSFLSLIYMVYLIVIIIYKEDTFSSQSIGIIFTYSVLLQRCLGWLFNCCAQMETSMVSMERCMKYTDIISEKESVLPSDEKLISSHWPKEGTIRFEDYSVKYRPNTEVVLKHINFSINSNEKVGIVGRTGSGKSTICLCLFRILEPLTGTIYIDDEDITNIGLDLLRQNITIIPQDPCLMAGTLKYNIDPFNRTDDKEIIKVLNEIGFDSISKLSNKEEKKTNILDRMIEQNGTNLSVGEKQLVCIARAILRKTKIVVMDEATANIDIKTEEKIQNALHSKLNNSTIITIAHRIKTIINYDKILVLDSGNVAEFDSPQTLLKNENSIFYQLYSKSVL